jgi:beta-phosphoglucomutase-like phosphatase (HAD superfamily)
LILQAIFFDFDGVIADSEPLHLRAYQSVLGAENIELGRDEYYASYLGYDDAGLFEALAKDRGLEAGADRIDGWIDKKSRIVESLLRSDDVLFPGASACVRMCAAAVPLAIASGALEPEIRLVLDHSGLTTCFRAIASASDGVRGKPAPDLYMLAIAKLGNGEPIDPRRCVAIEDSRWGLEAARRAGLHTVAVAHTYPAAELGDAALVVSGLAEITIPRLEQIVRDNGRAT